MATYQTSYPTSPAKGLPGQIASEEKSNRISRTVESAAGIPFGQPAFRGSGVHGVVAGAAFAATATSAALGTNTGNGVMGAITVSAGAKAGTYTLTITQSATNAGAFMVEDPDGKEVGHGNVASAFSAGGLAFTLADGATDFVSGDSFTLTVTYSADASFIGLAILDPAVPPNASTPDAYPQYFAGAFMTEGSMYVVADTTVTAGQNVYWNPSNGRYTNVTTQIRIPGAVFDTSGVSAGVVEVALRSRPAAAA
jgi:hypothetical protein